MRDEGKRTRGKNIVFFKDYFIHHIYTYKILYIQDIYTYKILSIQVI